MTDQNNKTTTYGYDDADRLTSVTDPAGNVTQYGYDTENNLTSITDANNHTTNFDYDAYGRVTKTTFPDQPPSSAHRIIRHSIRLTAQFVPAAVAGGWRISGRSN